MQQRKSKNRNGWLRGKKSDQDIELMFRTESLDLNDEMDVDDDEDWEDEDDDEEGRGKYNNLKLKYFAREVDRYQWSDRGAAKVANGLLKDLGLVRKGKTDKLICPAKVRRERQKWGRKEVEKHNEKWM